MVDPPVIKGQLDDEAWSRALSFTGFMNISHPEVAGEFPFRLAIAADERTLFVGLLVEGVPLNSAEPKSFQPDWADLHLTAGAEGLRPPADALFASNNRQLGTTWRDAFWNGASWEGQIGFDHSTPDHGGRPDGRWVSSHAAGDDLSWEFHVPRVSPYPGCDGFQVHGLEPFGLRVTFWRQTSGEPARAHYPPQEPDSSAGWIALRFPTPLPPEFVPPEVRPCEGSGA